KPALARGELQAIGATTLDEYRKYIERDAALERRFQPIMVNEPSVDESIAILQGLRDRYEAHHRVQIPDYTIEQAVKLADRYISDRFLPDKAIDVIDEAASKVRISAYNMPPNLKELEKNLEEMKKEKDAAVQSQEFEKAAALRDDEQKLRVELEQTIDKWRETQGKTDTVVTVDDVAQVISSWTGVPVKKLTEEETERLIKMEEILHRRVIGQDEAVESVSRAIRRARAGLKDPKRPIGSFIFLGPTGVGKTELARALAEAMFEDENAIIRIDMSEYMEKHSTSRLVGAPPGYVGFDEGGQLTEKIRRKPYSVVLLDEIEKAHPEVFNILLQVLEDGRLTDSKGRTVDFRNAIIIMTSNVGAELIRQDKTLGFATGEADNGYKDMKDQVLRELKKTFRPEFLNRLDEIIVFHSLKEEQLRRILELMVAELKTRLADKEIDFDLTDEAKEFLLKEGYDATYGARPLRRMVQKHIEDVLSEELLKGTIAAGSKLVLELDGDKLAVKK
ncbi:MAG: ATP-dependent Clp protease ATP-binding subunit, partial [Anaerovoracaceae bacterium]